MILKAAVLVIVNFILYMAFGSFFAVRKGKMGSLAVTCAVGFFAYYALFSLFCLPVMLTYRPLSLLARMWIAPCVVAPVLSAVLFRRAWREKFAELAHEIKDNKGYAIAIAAIIAMSVILVTVTYNFTLDAAYYVAGVGTNVDTNMINVYDPFTGAWLDHFELRYVFSTYYVNDAVICSLTSVPALIMTKTVMSATIMILVNVLYVHVAGSFFAERRRALLMYVMMVLVNFLFISIYTTSNFLMTRTYEGKSVVGNISVLLIFILYMQAVYEDEPTGMFLKLFVTCLGTATVSSTANMVIPAEVCILFIPYAILQKRLKILPKILVCILPEIVMMIVYVLYVKGWFAVYTYPR